MDSINDSQRRMKRHFIQEIKKNPIHNQLQNCTNRNEILMKQNRRSFQRISAQLEEKAQLFETFLRENHEIWDINTDRIGI